MKHREREPDQQESRAAVAVTIAWMLTCMSTAAGILVVLTLTLLMVVFPVAAGGRHPLERIADVLLFLALVTGIVCLALTVLAHRTRQIAPPRAITIAAVVIGFLPIVTIVLLTLFST